MNAKELDALKGAYEQQVVLMYTVLLSALVLDNANVEEACQRFRRGLALARKALDLASKIISE